MSVIHPADWKKRCAQLLTALLLMRGACGLASVIRLPLADAATAIDNGPEDGIFDAFSSINLGSVNDNGFTSFRTALEFGLSAIPAGATINAASLSVLVDNFEGTRQITVNGYAGDGKVQLTDFSSDHFIGTWTVPPAGATTLNLDVTALLSQLVSNRAAFAGFDFRQEPANTNNFLVMSLDMAGAAPALAVDFSPAPASAGIFQYAFTNNADPRLWNFGGLYSVPFYNTLRWRQDGKGAITAYYGIAAPTNIALIGAITGGGSSLKLRLRSTMEFEDFGGMRKDRLSLSFDPSAQLFTGSDRISETTEGWVMDCPNSFWECDHWKWVKSTSSFTQPVVITTPETTDGNWMLTLEIAQVGNKLSGTGLITFANGETLPFQLVGSYAPKSQRSKILLKGTGGGKGANLMFSLAGPEMKIERMHGIVGGQSVKFP